LPGYGRVVSTCHRTGLCWSDDSTALLLQGHERPGST
jgi:hypothetical protein